MSTHHLAGASRDDAPGAGGGASPSAAHAIRTEQLTKRYRTGLRTTTAVDGLDLVVPAGSSFGLLGPNGAGKTTTIQMVLGLVRPSSGRSELLGSDVGQPEVRRAVGFVPEKFQLPRSLSCREFLHLHATLHGLHGAARDRRIDEVLGRVALADRQHDRLGGFSKGMQQRAAIAQALLGRPRLLVLDEPTSALDPIGRRQVRELIGELRQDGATIVLNSHLLSEIEAICDHVAILRNGRLVHQGSIAGLADGSVHVTLRLLDADAGQARAALLAAGAVDVDARAVDGGLVEARCAVAGEREVARIAAALHRCGMGLVSVVPERERLEDLFVRLVEAPQCSDPAGAGQHGDAPAPTAEGGAA